MEFSRAFMGRSEFLKRHCFASEGRLVDEEILGRNQPEVGGDHVSGRQQNDVARHKSIDRNIDVVGTSLSAHRSGYRYHLLQFVGSIVRPILLKEAQGDAQDYHNRDHDRRTLIAEEIGCRRQRQQQDIQRIDRARSKLAENRMTRLPSDPIGSNGAELLLDLARREAHRRAGQPLQRIVG